MNKNTKPGDVYTQITSKIVASIEAGAGTWQMPWHSAGEGLNRPVNIVSGKPYRGINVLSLWASSLNREFETGIWGTYRQWQLKGAQVRKGEKASLVVFYKELEDPASDAADTDDAASGPRRVVAKASYVFNADQVDGYARPAPAEPTDPVSAIAAADAFIAGTGARINHGGAQAYYRPSDDTIQMPDIARFSGSETSNATEAYYGTLLHELTHWTGHARRLDRQFGKRFGDDAYGVEELVAELGAAFLCADLGIANAPRPDHAAYIDHWLRILKADSRAVFTAAAQAAKAADFLAALQQTQELQAAE